MNAQKLTRTLGGYWHGTYGMARCPVHDDKTPSLAVRDSNDGALLVFCHAGCEQRAVIDELKRRRLWSGSSSAARRLHGGHNRISQGGGQESENQHKIEFAREIWGDSRPAQGTPTEKYLRGRGIMAPIPPSVRFHHGLRHAPTGLVFPAMIAAIQNAEGQIVGIHRTYLQPGGRGKANVLKPKMSLGKCRGGAVRLAAAAHNLAVGEGIETTLSFYQATKTPAWAAISTSGLRSLTLPPMVREVTIAADGDPPGEEAAQAAAAKWTGEGRKVRIARPPDGFDFNDVLRGKRTAKMEAAS